MERALDLFKEEIVSTTEEHGLGLGGLHTLKEGVIPVTNALFVDLAAVSKVAGLESLFALEVSEGHDDLTTSAVGNTSQIALLNTSDGNAVVLNEVLESEIINTTRAEDNVGTSFDDLLASLAGNVHLALSDLLEVLGVLHEHLDAHSEAVLVQVEVNEGDLSVVHVVRHALG